jgi:hypothetical protein
MHDSNRPGIYDTGNQFIDIQHHVWYPFFVQKLARAVWVEFRLSVIPRPQAENTRPKRVMLEVSEGRQNVPHKREPRRG